MKLNIYLKQMKNRLNKMKGFTLVELLIVIALIAILSVAVLATINPIEQSNKATDSTTQNDAAEVMNAYERYYTSARKYPWMVFVDSEDISVDTAVVYDSKQAGFGICFGDTTTADSTTVGACNTSGSNMGVLISTDELKTSFVSKNSFAGSTEVTDKLWTVKMPSSSGGIYVCYIPKAKANRQLTDKLYCINNGVDDETILVKASVSTTDNCEALTVSSAGWDTPTLDGNVGMFRCVPE